MGEMVEEVPSKLSSKSQPLNWFELVHKNAWFLVAGWLLLVVVITSYLPLWIHSVDLNIYVFQPALWLSLGYMVYRFWLSERENLSLKAERWLVGLSFLTGLFQISVMVLAGVVVGFGQSPYGREFYLILLNAWFILTRLIGLEAARWYILSSLKRRNVFLGVSLSWFILFLAILPITRIWTSSLGGPEDVFRLFGNTLLPIASENILATYLALIGGPFASYAYRFILAVFEWFSPILPNLQWTLNAFLGTVVPILGLLFVREALDWKATQQGEKEANKEGVWGTGWILVGVFLVFIIWFNSGLFGVRPTLISGISMEPAINPGDIVITRDVTANEVKQGDVVLFTNGKYSILHRVVEIQKDDNQLSFITKGDNVVVAEEPWPANQLKGKLVMIIPKVGWISIGIKILFNRLF